MIQKNTLFIIALISAFLFMLLSMTAYATPDVSPCVEPSETLNENETQSNGSNDRQEENTARNGDAPKVNVVQIITSGGVIATAILGIANLITSARKIHIDGISNKRNLWIDSVRNITANIVCYDLRNVCDQGLFEDKYNEFLKNAYILSLYLNIQGPFDRVVSDYLIKFVKSQHQQSDDFTHNRRMLNFAVQVYLKSEWNRVKYESGLNPFKKFDEKKSITTILSSLKGDYVDELRKEYEKYLGGEKMVAPVFFEYVELKCE